ncbi:MAG: pyruvate ferredoxin oxidoreductase [Candidatus Aenigmatarchaeota archaeon]|nr:MAG: pyruvate ferredoxin oxidoreductase [Candidatus Aenigmarchaeota archaeon]
MIKGDLLSGSEAAVLAAQLSSVRCTPMYPMIPQDDIVKKLSDLYSSQSDGKKTIEFFTLESPVAALSASIASEATGTRTFTVSTGPGLESMKELMYVASGMRLPLVMVNVSRSLSPTNIWNEHTDILSCRDTGWLIFITSNNQELLDTIIQAYKIAENKKVLLPVLVNMDAFLQSHTRENVFVPSERSISKFLPELNLPVGLNTSKPVSLNPPVKEEYMEFKAQQHIAMKNAEKIIRNVDDIWNKKFHRKYGLIERFHMEDAKYVIVVAGSAAEIAKTAVQELRAQNEKVGLLRPRVIRPWPKNDIREALKNAKKVAVVDQDIMPGTGGILYQEIKASISSEIFCSNFIAGLGGKKILKEDFLNIYERLKKSEKEEEVWL